APARQPAEADTEDLLAGVVELPGDVRYLVPGGVVGHGQPRLLEEVLAVHEKRGLAVEGHRVEAVLVAQSLGNAGDEVREIVGGLLADVGAEVLDPGVL